MPGNARLIVLLPAFLLAACNGESKAGDAEEEDAAAEETVEDVADADVPDADAAEDPVEDPAADDAAAEDAPEDEPADDGPEDPAVEDLVEEEAAAVCTTDFLSFDGSEPGVLVADDDVLSFSGDVTIEVWVRFESYTGNQRIVTKWGSGGAQNEYVLHLWGGEIGFVGSNTTYPGEVKFDVNFPATDPDLPPEGTWLHLAGVLDASAGQARVYLDGELKDSASFTETMGNSASPVRIGFDYTTSGSHFGGAMMELRLWETARTEAEIRDSMYCRMEGTESGLRACYPMDEGGASTAIRDAAGTAPDGDIQDCTWESGEVPVCSCE